MTDKTLCGEAGLVVSGYNNNAANVSVCICVCVSMYLHVYECRCVLIECMFIILPHFLKSDLRLFSSMCVCV